MQGFFSYVGQVIYYYICIAVMFAAWLSSSIYPTPIGIYYEDPWPRLPIMLAMTAVAVIILIFSKGFFRLFGLMFTVGAGLGSMVTLAEGIAEWISDAYPSGFFEWVGLFFVCAILVAIISGILGAGFTSSLRSLFKLDFYSTIVNGMICWSAFFALGTTLMAIMDCSMALFIITLVAGIPSGVAGGSAGGDGLSSFIDEYGQTHYTSHSMGRDRVYSTDGNIFRRTSGGWTNRHM